MTDQTQDQTQAAEKQAKPKPAAYEFTKAFVLADGSETLGEIPSNLQALRFSDSAGNIDVSLESLGISESNSHLGKIAVWAALNILSGVMARVPAASQAEKNANKTYAEIARGLIADRVKSFGSGEFSGISTGQSSVPVFDLILSRMFDVDLGEAQRRVDAKRAQLGKDAFGEWQKTVRANAKYAKLKAEYDLERATKAGANEADIDF